MDIELFEETKFFKYSTQKVTIFLCVILSQGATALVVFKKIIIKNLKNNEEKYHVLEW